MKNNLPLCSFIKKKEYNKLLLIMKITFLLTFLVTLHVSASVYSQNKLLNLDVNNTSIREVFKKIESESNFRFFYNEDFKDLSKIITLRVKGQPIDKILDKVLHDSDVTYKIMDNNMIVITPLSSIQQVVTGHVFDSESGEPIPGVNILIEGTNNGTITNLDGSYSIEVEGTDQVLIFSYVGYISQSIPINGQNVINVRLSLDIAELNEVVVVGYSTQKRKDISGAISIVDVEKASTGASQQIGKQLQGRAAGVTVISTGQPGEQPSVRIRGINTFGNNDPLYIVDGVPTQDVNDLSPTDIESLQILKDASAASIYGSRASNGVIIITTKKGRSGVQINYNVSGGYTLPRSDNVWNVLSPLEMAKLKWMAVENTGGDPRPDPLYGSGSEPVVPDYIRPAGGKFGEVNEDDYYLIPEYTGGADQLATFNQIVRANKEGTDWYKEITRPAFTLNNTLSVSGGSEMGSYYFSVNHLEQQGTVIETYNKRSTFRINSIFNVSKNFRIGENITGSTHVNPTIDHSQTSAVGMSFTQQPIIPVHDIAGNYAGPAGIGSGFNPVALQERTRNDQVHYYRVFGNAFAEFDFLNDFTIRTSLGEDFSALESKDFTYPTYERAENIVNSSFSSSAAFNNNWIWTNTLTYNHTFNGIHVINILIGTEAYQNTGKSIGGSTQDYFSFNPNYVNLSTGSGSKTNFSSRYENSLVSYFGRLDYSLMDKYILSATLRRDGSSKFVGDYRWGMFPAASVAWRISKENFMQDISWLSDLRIRASYGVVGNQLNVSSDNPYTLFVGSQGTAYYAIDGSNSQTQLGFQQSRIGNPDARWEKNVNGNIGFDAYLFDNSLSIMAEYYWKDIRDLLYNVDLPATMGMASPPYINVGHIRNRGVDASIEKFGTITGDLKYDAKLTMTAYRNKIVYIADGVDFFGGNTDYNMIGHPMNSFYGYKVQGFWQSQDEIDQANNGAEGGTYQTDAAVGRWRFQDINNDGIIDPDDRTFIGDPQPDLTYGLDVGLNYKNFDFDIFFYGSQGNEIFAYYTRYLDFYPFLEGAKSHDALYNSWTPDNRNAKLPIQENVSSFSSTEANNNHFVKNGSYMRIKNLVIGYTLPDRVLQKIKATKLRFYLQASNLLTLSSYEGLDPEVYGVDEASYANYPMYQLGLNLSF